MIALTQIKLALKGGQYFEGDIRAINEIFDRTDGRTTIALDEDEDEISMIFKINYSLIKSRFADPV